VQGLESTFVFDTFAKNIELHATDASPHKVNHQPGEELLPTLVWMLRRRDGPGQAGLGLRSIETSRTWHIARGKDVTIRLPPRQHRGPRLSAIRSKSLFLNTNANGGKTKTSRNALSQHCRFAVVSSASRVAIAPCRSAVQILEGEEKK